MTPSPPPDASATKRGLVTFGTQTLAGAKIFNNGIYTPASETKFGNYDNLTAGFLYRSGTAELGMSNANGAAGVFFNLGSGATRTTGNLTVGGAAILKLGTSGTDLALYPTGDTNTGLWFPTGATMNFVTGGVLRLQLGATGTATFGGAIAMPTNTLFSIGTSTLYEQSGPTGLRITGAGADSASAVGVSVDTSATYANATAKLFSIRNGGTEKAYFKFDGQLFVPGAAGISWGSAAGTITHNGTGFTLNTRATNAEYWQGTLFYQTGTGVSLEAASCARLSSDAADGASAVAAASEHSTAAWSNATSKLHSFRNGAGSANEKSAIMYNGEFEHAVGGAGIVLKSPGGTRYRITVADGGTLNIAAA